MHFWLRHEIKGGEHRTPLLPDQVKVLVASGHQVSVEKSPTRAFPDADYESNGATLVETGSWPSAPLDAFILGLKELPESDEPLRHTHIYFGHCYKYQQDWEKLLGRFEAGNGRLLDMEFLQYDNGRRVAAFGRSAGYVGAAVGLQAWADQLKNEHLAGLWSFQDFKSLAAHTEAMLKQRDLAPKVLVIGALGRAGGGAVQACIDSKVPEENITKWDMDETKGGGPFPQLLTEQDIVINCIYLAEPIPPFITKDLLTSTENRRLSVLVDVSCDTTNPHNPLPVYTVNSTFDEPCIRTIPRPNPFDVVSIDNLPSLVPSESSYEFATALFPHLQECMETPIWERAEKLFREKLAEANSARSSS